MLKLKPTVAKNHLWKPESSKVVLPPEVRDVKKTEKTGNSTQSRNSTELPLPRQVVLQTLTGKPITIDYLVLEEYSNLKKRKSLISIDIHAPVDLRPVEHRSLHGLNSPSLKHNPRPAVRQVEAAEVLNLGSPRMGIIFFN